MFRFFALPSLLLLAVSGVGATDDLDPLLALFSSGEFALRQQAQARLAVRLDEPQFVRELCSRYPGLPAEARGRVRTGVVQKPSCAALLLLECESAEPGPAAAARELLLELLTWEIGRRRQRGATRDGSGEVDPFEHGTITGHLWPLGGELPLWYVLEWLQQTVAPKRPLVLDPGLDPGGLLPVEPRELLPSTASALLTRLLERRSLAVVDLGPIYLLRDQAVVEDGTEDGDDDSLEPGASDRRERRAAQLLVRLLVGDEVGSPRQGPTGSPAARAALFHALRLDGAGEIAARSIGSDRTGADQPPDLRDLLSLGSVGGRPEQLLRLLSGQAPDRIRLLLLLHLVRHRELAKGVLADLLSGADPIGRRAGCFLAGQLDLFEQVDALRRLCRDRDRGVAVAAALALSRIDPAADGLGPVLARTLRPGIPEAALRATLEQVGSVHLANPGTLPAEPFLTGEDPGCRAVGGALLAAADLDAGCFGRERSPAVLTDRWALAAYLLVLGADRQQLRRVPWSVPRAVAALSADPRLRGALSLVLARRFGDALLGPAWLATARAAAAGADPVLLGMLTSIAADDFQRDETYRTGLLRSLLRRPAPSDPLRDATGQELWRALTAERRGEKVRWMRAISLPISP